MTRIGHDGGGFAFDNEGPAHDTLLGRFHLANRLVTQHEYLAFIRDGGYSRPELWLSQGWDRVCAEAGARRSIGGERDDWQVFTLHGMQELELQAPVTHVSYFEPTPTPAGPGSGCRASPNPPRAASLTAAPACTPTCWKAATWIRDPRPPGQAGRAPPSLYGDAWEWTSSAYEAYPGFRPDSGAVGEYNGKFMCNQYVLRGGSCVTPRGHIRASYRNFFPPEARWQFSGIRLARDA